MFVSPKTDCPHIANTDLINISDFEKINCKEIINK